MGDGKKRGKSCCFFFRWLVDNVSLSLRFSAFGGCGIVSSSGFFFYVCGDGLSIGFQGLGLSDVKLC